jgi:hypothetical protein
MKNMKEIIGETFYGREEEEEREEGGKIKSLN